MSTPTPRTSCLNFLPNTQSQEGLTEPRGGNINSAIVLISHFVNNIGNEGKSPLSVSVGSPLPAPGEAGWRESHDSKTSSSVITLIWPTVKKKKIEKQSPTETCQSKFVPEVYYSSETLRMNIHQLNNTHSQHRPPSPFCKYMQSPICL